MNKKIFLVFGILIFLISLNTAFSQSDPLGCCTNPGAGDRACSTDRLIKLNQECCPKPELNFASYYKPQNPQGPSNYDDCSLNFFFVNRNCENVDACALGCCCSNSGGTITP